MSTSIRCRHAASAAVPAPARPPLTVLAALLLCGVVAGSAACRPGGPEREGAPAGDAASATAELAIAPDVLTRRARFVPTEIAADLHPLGDADRRILALLIEAAEPIDEIFWRQVSERNPAWRDQVATLRGPLAEAARDYFRINKGPWDRLDAHRPFIGSMVKPAGAGFYPEDLDQAAFEAYLVAHPDQREALTSLTTVVRRAPDGGLLAIPYREAYRPWLEAAAGKLREAAALSTNASLERFLETRAAAFLSDDYYESDVAWMDLDAPVEVTIGPYETYEDGLMGAKAAFEAYVTVALPRESEALAGYKAELPWLERNLPIPEEHKNLKRGTESPIRVVDVVLTAGDGNRGVQTIAFNLPNDERVREAKGSKKVMLRNVMRAKYEQILEPIGRRVLSPEDAARVSFDAFFEEALHHELAHGLGPGSIVKDGRTTEARVELKELYSPLEEAKADVMGVYDILALIEKGAMPKELRSSLEPTYVAGLFRAARFGAHEAHGRGTVSQFNYLLKRGALTVDAAGLFRIDSEKFPAALRDLLAEMLMLQARGDYAGTQSFLETYGHPGPELDAAIARLADVPTDIAPIFRQARELLAAAGAKDS